MAGLIFDLDGTLVDSAPDIHAATAAMLREAGAEPLAPATIRGFVGHGVPALVARVAAAAFGPVGPDRLAALEARFMAHYDAAPVALTRPYPGVADALDALAAGGHALGLCTNKPEATARAILRGLGLDRHILVVVGGDTTPARKPDPAPLRAAIAALGAGSALFVGDSEVDAETAAACGTPFLLYTAGYRRGPPEAMPHAAAFDRFDALPGLVAGIVGRA